MKISFYVEMPHYQNFSTVIKFWSLSLIHETKLQVVEVLPMAVTKNLHIFSLILVQ